MPLIALSATKKLTFGYSSFRNLPCERYTSSWPVPPSSQQPPHKPLLAPNPLASVYSLTTLGGPADPVQWTRAVPMVPTRKAHFKPSPVTGGLEIDREWAKMDIPIGILRQGDREPQPELAPDEQQPEDRDEEKLGRELRRKLLNPDFDSPFVKIRHEMRIALRLSWLPQEAVDAIRARYANVPAGMHRGERIRRARMAHPARLTETLLVSMPIRMVQVSEGVESIFRTMGVHHGASIPAAVSAAVGGVAMRRGLAQSRSGSPSPSSSVGSSRSMSGRASPAAVVPPAASLSIPTSSAMSRSSTPSTSSPAPSMTSLPSSSVSSSSSSSSASHASAAVVLAPYVAALSSCFPGPFVLPPYSELYYSNGDRKDSCGGGWLPKYEEREDEVAEDTAPPPAMVDSDSDDESEQEHGLSVSTSG